MTSPPRGPARVASGALLALALLVSGCGDAGLWARWRAERGVWRARRAIDRIEISPRLAPGADWTRAAAACRSVIADFPPARWSARVRTGGPRAAEVLMASGEAARLLARLDELAERREAALTGYERVRRDYSLVPAVALNAAVSRARLLARLGRGVDAEEAWAAIAREFPAADPLTGMVFDAVLDAPLIVARGRRERGDAGGVDSVLRVAESDYLRLLPGQRGRPAGPQLWMRVADARAARGDAAGARAALRQALADPAAGPLAPRLVLTLAQRALESGESDTALAYARWAERGFEAVVRPAALLIVARAWRAGALPESALATYETLLEDDSVDPDTRTQARFERGRLLEDLGRWDQARGEYHALAGFAPTHPLAFEAMMRLVRYPLVRGERSLGLVEARHALESLDALIASHEDDSVQVLAGQTRARLLFETDDPRGGCGALAALLRRYPEAPLDAALLMSAAEAAESRLDDTDLAVELYRAAAVRAGSAEARRRARAAAGRLSPTR